MSEATEHFLSSLFLTGEPVLQHQATFEPSAAGETLLREAFAQHTQGFLQQLPFHAPAAWLGARWLHSCCYLLADRSLSAKAMLQALPPLPTIDSPAAIMSLDVTLRNLPEVMQLVTAADPHDPLLEKIRQLAHCHVLSAPGILIGASLTTTALRAHPDLWRLYLDRVIEHQDHEKLTCLATHEAIAGILGEHPNLCPTLASRLQGS
jgi:hypothetical protein